MTVAGEGQVPVGQLLGEERPKRSRLRALLRWRDWGLPAKLGAVTLIPIMIALVLGGITVASQFERSDRYERIDGMARLAAATRTLLDGLQRERTLTAELLTEGRGSGSPQLQGIRAEVDMAVSPVTTAAAEIEQAGGAVAGPRKAVDEQLGRLANLRERVGAGQVGPIEAVTEYSGITTALLGLDSALVAGIGDDGTGATSNALHDLLVAREEVSVQQALVSYGIGRSGLAPSEVNQLRTSDVRLGDRIDDFRVAATDAHRQDFDNTVRGEAFDQFGRVVAGVLAQQDAGGDPFESVSPQQWSADASAVFAAMGRVADRMGTEVTGATGELADDAATGVTVLLVLLILALVLAAFVVFVITRQLLRSLKVLRNSALAVAEHELPEAVRSIQEGGSRETEIRPVPVTTQDEIGEVARAFDAVHSEALHLAAEQAGMRAGYASVFVNLSRRSQSLVQRQLALIERLESDEEDPDQLATLFQLDHLATRMRRNNENLMVLSGAEPGRRSGQPVSGTDVLRAAVSEIEQYKRVVVGTPPPVLVVGHAAGDLIRLVAELLDNATAFSAPETQVTVATRAMDDGTLSIDIMDRGIGMNEAEVAEANARLSESGSLDLTTSRRMGLFVVGRLAGRHGFDVMLHGGKDIVGVRATVTVPADLVLDGEGHTQEPQPAESQYAEPQYAEPEHVPQQAQVDGGPLPRRTRNGVAQPGMAQEAAGVGGSRRSPGEPGHVPAPTDNEVSGTALFTPVERDDSGHGHQAPSPAAARASQQAQQAQQAQPEWPVAADTDPHELDDGAPRINGTRPGRRRAVPASGERELSGRRLFESHSRAVSEWWNAAATASAESPAEPEGAKHAGSAPGAQGSLSEAQRRARKAAVDNAETTPIFDEMLSAWFRKVTDADAEAEAERPARKSWEFAADESWRAVQEVSQRSSAADYTQAGLPRRRRGEHLLPGSAAPRPAAAPPAAAAPAPQAPVRDPQDVRGRLSSFQQGVSRGRRHRAEPDAAAEPEDASAQQRPSWSAQGIGQTASGLPQRRPKRSARPSEAAEVGESPAELESGSVTTSASPAWASSGGWGPAADERWQTVRAVAESTPSSYTAAGLPRRRRGEQLLPGSVAPEGEPVDRPRVERDPADVRGRLSSFQQGVRRGRHRTAQVSESDHETVEGE
ncbi:signal transduction histidine kinase [Saccharomonospora amisosensis]|uniref:histidine kinase n=1 Tax=Saccharomonospora amisosensis TaxID=1128677 RepID=A0A7X5UR88_9PSEU|nr:nitrate- and nitrite sensing domain-containing protein [Saccharomonospora amisosensis]NIJ12753.1 signal transduction histidine kinase [Saccharomonospora amisosensis]